MSIDIKLRLKLRIERQINLNPGVFVCQHDIICCRSHVDRVFFTVALSPGAYSAPGLGQIVACCVIVRHKREQLADVRG